VGEAVVGVGDGAAEVGGAEVFRWVVCAWVVGAVVVGGALVGAVGAVVVGEGLAAEADGTSAAVKLRVTRQAVARVVPIRRVIPWAVGMSTPL
jgi:hypothetical protein